MADGEKKYLDADGLAYYDATVKADYAAKGDVPTKTSQLANDSNFAVDASYVHTDSNFTTDEKAKLKGIAENADVSPIKAITRNGTALTPSAGTVNITVPTDVKDLDNGSGYQTAADVESAIAAKGYQTAAQVTTAITGYGYQTAANVKSAVEAYGYQTASDVASAVANAHHLTRSLVDELPETGSDDVIYLAPSSSSSDGNVKDEWMWVDSKWEFVGTTAADLSGYAKTADLPKAITNAEIDAIVHPSSTAA